MKIDRKAVGTLLALDDAQLKFVIDRAAFAAGIDTRELGLYGIEVGELRRRLASLTDADLDEINKRSGN